jgi:hypothetical protein
MKLPRVRIGTLMLWVVIAALSVALVVQNDRAAKREAALRREWHDALTRWEQRSTFYSLWVTSPNQGM